MPTKKNSWENYAFLAVFLTVAVLGASLFFTSRVQDVESATDSQETLIQNGVASGQTATTGASAPDFALHDVQGELVSLASLTQKPTLIIFETTTCTFCHMEGSDIEKLRDAYKDRVNVVSIDIRETANQVKRSLATRNLTRPFLIDESGEVSMQYGISGTPTHFFVDTSGKVVARRPGLMSYEQLQEFTNKLLES